MHTRTETILTIWQYKQSVSMQYSRQAIPITSKLKHFSHLANLDSILTATMINYTLRIKLTLETNRSSFLSPAAGRIRINIWFVGGERVFVRHLRCGRVFALRRVRWLMHAELAASSNSLGASLAFSSLPFTFGPSCSRNITLATFTGPR